MKYFNKTYENGLKLVFQKTDSPVSSICIMVTCGSQDESKDEEGYAHLIEHMTFKSSKNYSSNEILDNLAMLGTDYNAYTSRSVTRFVFRCIKENFEESLKIYSDIILNSKFEKDELDREKQVVIEEMKRSKDDPIDILCDEAFLNFYDGSSYAHDSLGSEKNILNATREKLFTFKYKYYRPNNFIVSVVGDYKFEEIDELINKYLASQMAATGMEENRNFSVIEPNIKSQFKIVKRSDEQANVLLQIKSVTSSSDKKYIADIYASILGSSSSSRLFKEIRENLGLVYSIYAYCEANSRTGEISVIFGTRPANVEKAIKKIREVIVDLAKNGITDDELLQAKNIKKSSLAYSIESSSDQADLNASAMYFKNEPITIDERIKHYSKVTIEDVNDFAKMVACEKVYAIVAVGKGLKQKNLEIYKNI